MRVLEGYLDTGRGDHRARDAVVVQCDTDVRVARQWRMRDVDCCLLEGSVVDVAPYRHEPAEAVVAENPGFVFGYVVAGAMRITQDRRAVELGSGQVALYDGVTPFALHSEAPHRYLVAHVRDHALRIHRDDRDALVARDLSAFAGAAALGALLATMVDADRPPPPAAGQHLGDAVLACLSAIVAESRGTAVGERSTMLFGELTDWLDVRLADHLLTTESLAAAHFLSTRYIRKLFADHGTTVTGYVRTRRLERIREDLLHPRNVDVPVSAIAGRWGFRDPSVFSRAFAREFGQAPQTFRRTALQHGQAPLSTGDPRP
ncbi:MULTISPECIES: AraC family transcriptional regulator [unclassified Modestobacter]|uniref:AraC family transcriptional regulator n=1 Tax=unclassified Modestobacter TaxID=2643866 RepID=UPI0022AAAF4A|nr:MULTISPECIES: AraC family transcriptional regulator [unclassified Modestobacter]MCZ2826164.1 helix-turn-helix transcriptional regulator [Modestobacter sp. VKM Ac-2981]MCZ2852771.1 helix-turn-helix transcriptional regulator [Modestobacter sp. VKM Ac-2982]